MLPRWQPLSRTWGSIAVKATVASSKLVNRAGLGQFLHLEEITLENLRTLISSVVTDPQLQTNAKGYQAKFAALPGIAGGADWLEAHAG